MLEDVICTPQAQHCDIYLQLFSFTLFFSFYKENSVLEGTANGDVLEWPKINLSEAKNALGLALNCMQGSQGHWEDWFNVNMKNIVHGTLQRDTSNYIYPM